MSLEFYRVLHIVAIVMTVIGLAGVIAVIANGGKRNENKMRWTLALTHGFGMAFLIISGFGMLAKANLGFPQWVWVKLAIWLWFGGIMAIAIRKPQASRPIWFTMIVLAAVAAYLGIFKPF